MAPTRVKNLRFVLPLNLVGDDVRRVKAPKRGGMKPMNSRGRGTFGCFFKHPEVAMRKALTKSFIGRIEAPKWRGMKPTNSQLAIVPPVRRK